MNRYNVTIQSAHYGTWNYSGQPEEYLIQDEERSSIQILRLILNHLIFYKLKLNGNFYDTVEDKTQLIKEIYQTIKKKIILKSLIGVQLIGLKQLLESKSTRKAVLMMSKYTVTIENLLHGNNSCLKQEKILIKEEEKTTNQILDLLLRYPIFLSDTKINSTPAYVHSHTYPASPSDVRKTIGYLLDFIEFNNNILTISYMNEMTKTEITITVKKH